MTDWSNALARAFKDHLEFSGSSGSGGSHRRFDNSSKGMRQGEARTSSCDAVVLVVPAGASDGADCFQRTTATTASGEVVLGGVRAKEQQIQSCPDVRTTDTTGTTEQDRHRAREGRIVEWLNQHPAPSPAGACAWCHKPDTLAAVVLPFGIVPGTHTWLHAECWPAWHERRRGEALRALQANPDSE